MFGRAGRDERENHHAVAATAVRTRHDDHSYGRMDGFVPPGETSVEQTDRGLSFTERVFKRYGDGCSRAVTVLRRTARADLFPDAELKIGGGCRDYVAPPMLSSTPAIVVASSSDGGGAVKM